MRKIYPSLSTKDTEEDSPGDDPILSLGKLETILWCDPCYSTVPFSVSLLSFGHHEKFFSLLDFRMEKQLLFVLFADSGHDKLLKIWVSSTAILLLLPTNHIQGQGNFGKRT